MFWKEEPIGRFVAHPGNWDFESLLCYESGPFCGKIVVVDYIETLWYSSSKVKHVWNFRTCKTGVPQFLVPTLSSLKVARLIQVVSAEFLVWRLVGLGWRVVFLPEGGESSLF